MFVLSSKRTIMCMIGKTIEKKNTQIVFIGFSVAGTTSRAGTIYNSAKPCSGAARRADQNVERSSRPSNVRSKFTRRTNECLRRCTSG